ncbi:MAG TPA: MEDS domain-containing protein [Burkholderiales bacterium]|nr:MEDS domain-containing protein [Burkholderiales bacterium]
MNPTARHGWQDLLKQPALGDHIVQTYQDHQFLADAVGEYIGSGLRSGDAAVIIARPAHRAAFTRRLAREGIDVNGAIAAGQLRLFDAEETLARFMCAGMPDWDAFRALIGGIIAELRLQYGTVRAYGEMVDILWQDGRRDAAIRLEEHWNELGELQTFSLLCAYYMDALDTEAYGGALERVCKVHSHLIPVRDYDALDEAVAAASRRVLDEPLSRMMLSLAAQRGPGTEMPLGQAALLWLKKNMPLTAEKVLAEVRARA